MAKPHMIMFPFMAQGHILPLLDLAKTLARRGIKITFFTTPSNSKSITQTPDFAVEVLDFPTSRELPNSYKNTELLGSMDLFESFFFSSKRLQDPFERTLEKMLQSGDSPPLCIISDFFLPWTLESGSKFNIPRLVFYSFSAYSLSISKSVFAHLLSKGSVPGHEPFEVSGLPTRVILAASQLIPHMRVWDETNSMTKLTLDSVNAELGSHGIVLNTFEELEPVYAPHLCHYYRSPVWYVGPLGQLDQTGCRGGVESHVWKLCSNWLDGHIQQPRSVLYASFGTVACVADLQLTEIAWGLESSGCPFLLLVRSTTWQMPDGFEERMADRGLVLREWAPQLMVLNHTAVGGFLTHCGWNSVLESLTAGVPMLAWPMVADQPLNEKMVVEELSAGIRLQPLSAGEPCMIIGRDVVCTRVLELMAGEEGLLAREKAAEISRSARAAVKEDGSSYTSLTELIDSLCFQRTHLTIDEAEKQEPLGSDQCP